MSPQPPQADASQTGPIHQGFFEWYYNRRLDIISHGPNCSLCAQWTHHYVAGLTYQDAKLEDALEERKNSTVAPYVKQMESLASIMDLQSAQLSSVDRDIVEMDSMRKELRDMRKELGDAHKKLKDTELERDTRNREYVALQGEMVKLQAAYNEISGQPRPARGEPFPSP